MNQPFGQLQVGRRSSYSYLRCNWVIGNAGISQAVALLSLQELYLSSYRLVIFLFKICLACNIYYIHEINLMELIF